MIGILGVLLAVAAIVFQNEDQPATDIKIDEYTREKIKERVRDYRARDLPPQVASSAFRKYVEKEELPEQVSDDFRVIKHEVVLDFNNFKRLSSVELTNHASAVIKHVNHVIRKKSDASTFKLTAATSGLDVYIQSHSQLTVYANDEHDKFGPYSTKRRITEFDTAKFPVGSEFSIQHTKTYWNAFQGQDQSWTGYLVRMPTDEIDYLIIFPKNKPFDSIELYATESNGARRSLNRESYTLKDDTNTWFWWRAVKPPAGTTYIIDWDW